MPTPRHRGPRERTVLAGLLLIALGSVVLAAATLGGPQSASAATAVPKASCKRIDPNLVRGLCLQYVARSGVGYTWIGSYRADDGKVFFCIDYLYDSRIVSRAPVVGTEDLENQLGARIGGAEVAALNYLISTWAPHGSTGTDDHDAAIALIIREVMSDSVRVDGTVVYRPGLKVGGSVAAPVGGLSGGVLGLARSLWAKASRYAGPGQLVLTGPANARVELGDTQEYRVAVVSASAHAIPGLEVSFRCSGPIRCPRAVTTATSAVTVPVTPTAVGVATIRATVSAPAGDGKLLQLTSWRTHAGRYATDNGVQRGWIGQRNTATARAAVEARIVKVPPPPRLPQRNRPSLHTAVPAGHVLVGGAVHDVVAVGGLPDGASVRVGWTLLGPLASRGDSCAGLDWSRAPALARGSFVVEHDGRYATEPVHVRVPGCLTFAETLAATATTSTVTSPPGQPSETVLVTRPRIPVVPEVPSGPARGGR